MRILLIGGSGFIGPHVASALVSRGHDVTVFHRGTTTPPPGTRALIGDRKQLADHAADLRAVRPDVVVDLILSSGAQAQMLVDVFRNAASRLVVLSSCDVYRACGVLHRTEDGPLQELPLTEQSALRTRLQTYPPAQIERLKATFGWLDDDYDKIPVEREILGRPALPGTVLRLPMVYGPGDPLARVATVVERLRRGDRVVLERKQAAWRGPRGYVENVAEAIALAALSDRAAGRIYNVAEPDALPELAWMQEIADAIGWKGTFETAAARDVPADLVLPGNLDQHWVVDSTRIREELGYAETVSRHDAIVRSAA